MSRPVPSFPSLPRSPNAPVLDQMVQFDADLVRSLFLYLSDMARRVNDALTVDGESPMEGDLNLGGFDIINVGATTQSGQLRIEYTADPNHIVLQDTGATGAAANGGIRIEDSVGTRKQYIGDASGSDSDLYLISDAGNIRLNPVAGGSVVLTQGQLAFPSTQVPSADANTLDDYEEGTYIPGIEFGGGTTGITYGARTGEYLKIGKLVMFVADITLTNKGSSTGTAGIVLPFPSAGVQKACPVSYMLGMVGVTNTPVGATTGSIAVLRFFTTTGVTVMNETHFSNTSRFIITGVYEATS